MEFWYYYLYDLIRFVWRYFGDILVLFVFLNLGVLEVCILGNIYVVIVVEEEDKILEIGILRCKIFVVR